MLFGYLIYRLIIHFYIVFVFSLVFAMIEGIFQLSLDRVLQDFQTPLSNSSSKYPAMHHIKHLWYFLEIAINWQTIESSHLLFVRKK